MVIRIGCVPYLNAKPLVHGVSPQGPGYSLQFAVPSRLAALMRRGDLDVALLSSIEFFRHPEYSALPGMGIVGIEEMWSVRLFHRPSCPHPLRIALDPASETTNALLKLVWVDFLGLKQTRWIRTEWGAPESWPDLDGFLKIGDPALAFSDPAWGSTDLLRIWRIHTGKPFVFALWLARPGVDLGEVRGLLERAKEEGLAHRPQIARQAAPALGISQTRALEYLTRIVKYDLGQGEWDGLNLFGRLLQDSLRSTVLAKDRAHD